ncbi:MAG: hypothetical protein ACRDQ5_20390 [Sciscionella sp.]
MSDLTSDRGMDDRGMKPKVLTELTDGIALITTNRPEMRNAVDLEVAQALAAAVDELEARKDLVLGGVDGLAADALEGARAFAERREPR